MSAELDPPEPAEPLVPEEAVPWPAVGGDGDVLSCLESAAVGLRELRVARCSRARLPRMVQRLRVVLSQVQAAQLEAVAEFDRVAPQPSNVALELSLGLAVSKHTARYQIGLAHALTTRLPNTLEAMRRGEIDSFKASRVYDVLVQPVGPAGEILRSGTFTITTPTNDQYTSDPEPLHSARTDPFEDPPPDDPPADDPLQKGPMWTSVAAVDAPVFLTSATWSHEITRAVPRMDWSPSKPGVW
ncbi:hypothetical protein [Amycolatopsis pigmentata]|uniref:DUF222 domain-containing protein n=1 Tax=Amycolatopsis pigmentata TaxID=450801 RepID=A0ABW5FX90_9PSEU